ncbi:sensor histidine kinase [Agrococcus sp. HG114]|uniref:sensor histidine kinase n=1 Tax=Agrococcus sp. HG114 TaxID=2969757 RepID=UPI00215A3123|nr:histidine kinase [Agrococcus sp. HG114]MCR8670594.1 histidine kinase [Agrococcus sp. HG114]
MMTTQLLRRGAPWWPAPIAIVMLGSMIAGSQLSDALALGAALLILGGLACSMRWPLPAFAAVLVGSIAAAPTEPRFSGFLLLLAFAAAALAAWGLEPLTVRLLSGIPLAIVAATAISWQASVAATWWGGSIGPSFAHVLGGWLPAMLAWAAVVGARALRDALRSEHAKQQAVARTTVVESELRDERLRADLTHDFHDVMAHSLAVLAAQAEGLRLTHEAHPERIGPVLTTISDTARLALVEVRQLLERVDDDARRPQPTSADIPGLVAQTRSAGPDVQLLDVGTRGHLSRIADIAAYRIVQESLTNALRHGGADVAIVVALSWTGPGLTLAVSSPIRDRAALRPAGRGIAGMHERVRLAGGTLEIDADGERFVVSAHLPYQPVDDAPTRPLTEDQLATLPVPLPPEPVRPEEVVAPWIVEATRLQAERRAARPTTAPGGWSRATKVNPGTGHRRPAATE